MGPIPPGGNTSKIIVKVGLPRRPVVFFQSSNHLGLISLDGIVAPTQAFPGLAGDTECRR
jgi:hypothetical protein